MYVPAAANVWLKLAPGASVPEFHAPPSAVEVCAMLSELVHVTVPPAEMLIGLGENALVVRVDAPATIATGVPEGAPGAVPPLCVGDAGEE